MLSILFLLWPESVFCAPGPEIAPKVKYFKKFSSDFNKQGLKWRLITTGSYFEEKNRFFFSKFVTFHKKTYFFWLHFFSFFFLPTYMFDFNKWGLKLKLITTDSYIEEKNMIFFQKLEFFPKKMYFFHVNLFFEKFRFLPVHMFDFNKWCLKWNDRTPSNCFS